MNDDNIAYVDAAVEAARIGGGVLKEYSARAGKIAISQKGLNDYVTEVDQASERAILGYLQQRFPEHSIIAEESSAQTRDRSFQWYVDPLDGTTNFIHGVPVYAVSVGLAHEGRMVAGAVYDPVRDEMFHAVAEGGAFLNKERIHITERDSLKGALIATGFPFRAHTRLREYLRSFEMFILQTAGIRRCGSASLDLCYTACGRYDGFYEMSLSTWDIAAGSLIVKEAGGLITDFIGRDGYLKSGNVVVANRRIHAAMLDVIRQTMV